MRPRLAALLAISVFCTLACALVVADIRWSRHSKPFDLVWDKDHEDVNGLPINPEWAYQLNHPGELPDFQATCPAGDFPGASSLNGAGVASNCTSQFVSLDVNPGAWLGFACQGFIDGHLNWTVATYTGKIFWGDYSGGWPQDGDYNLEMMPSQYEPHKRAGFTSLNDSGAGEFGLGMEFKGGETLDNTTDEFWTGLANSNSPANMFNNNIGLDGVATGLVGIDGVHGGYTEMHPVFAIALKLGSNPTTDGGEDQHWAFFVRNFGNEGECSQNTHYWGTSHFQSGAAVYYVQLPWPDGATQVKVIENQEWAWQSGSASWIGEYEQGLTVLKAVFPNNGGQNGMDGDFTLHYTIPHRHDTAAQKPPDHAASKKHEDEVPDLSERISDPATRAKFKSDLAALKPLADNPPRKGTKITADITSKPDRRTPGAASREDLTAAKTLPDPAGKRLQDALKRVSDKYGQQLKLAPGRRE